MQHVLELDCRLCMFLQGPMVQPFTRDEWFQSRAGFVLVLQDTING